MKLLLIAPASEPWHHVGRSRWFNGKTFRFSLLSLLTVAAETPDDNAASSLGKPRATACQNSFFSARPADGRPGDRIAGLPE